MVQTQKFHNVIQMCKSDEDILLFTQEFTTYIKIDFLTVGICKTWCETNQNKIGYGGREINRISQFSRNMESKCYVSTKTPQRPFNGLSVNQSLVLPFCFSRIQPPIPLYLLITLFPLTLP